MYNWYNVPQHTTLQKTILESSGDSITKRSTPSVSLKRKVRGSAAGNPGFGGCPLAAHAGHSNSRRTSSRTSGRAGLRRRALKNSSLLGCMDILNDLLLDTCFTVATILIARKHFVRHHLVSPITVWDKFVLLCLHRKRTSNVQVFQVRSRLCHSAFLWRLACEISQQVHSIFSWESHLVPFEPRVVMDEISEVRIVHDIEMTSIVQLHSLGGSSKQSVLTQNIELTRPKHGQ